ncbi:hypothetical protein ACQ858_22790 [Variovorax ureilyticus]|uniref:hypothetical protein n=1 Tax=Variovorax ureilyticus TaxID=1836198 RepID=UPI003D6667B7
MGWAYTSSGVVSNNFYKECSSAIGSAPGSGVFSKVTMTSSSADAQNYANWYSYYRKRYLLMRTAMGRAINALDSNYRVGFSTIYDSAAQDGKNNFVDVSDFDATQKVKFYNSLYGVAPSGNTPLPTALSTAGRYFAHMISGQSSDPVQYACQRNYTLMSTDGYWNVNNSVRLDGKTAIGQQDGTELRPMKDDAVSIVTKVTTYTAPATQSVTVNLSSAQTFTRTATTISSTNTGTTKKPKYNVTTQTQVYTERTQSRTDVTPQSSTASYTVTVVTTDGVDGSPVTSPVTYSSWINAATTSTVVQGPDGGAPPTGSSSKWVNSGSAVVTTQTTAGNNQTTYSSAVGVGGPGSREPPTPRLLSWVATTMERSSQRHRLRAARRTRWPMSPSTTTTRPFAPACSATARRAVQAAARTSAPTSCAPSAPTVPRGST